jgi:hypothetical protein
LNRQDAKVAKVQHEGSQRLGDLGDLGDLGILAVSFRTETTACALGAISTYRTVK